MLLLVMRHAKAHAESPTGLDADRALRARGERQAAFIAGALASPDRAASRPARLLSSRAARATQTAAILADRLALRVEFDDRLFIDAPLSGVFELIEELAASRDASLIVGHNPTLETLVNALQPGAGPMPLRTGELVAFDRSQRTWRRAWSLRLDEDD